MNKNNTEIHIVLGCVHLPFHNEKFFNAICHYIKDINKSLSGVHLIGDILDMHSISRHGKGQINIPGLTLGQEYFLANKALDKLDLAIGKNKKIQKNYFWGNHENWYNVYMADVNSFKLGKDVIKSPTEACKFIKRGYKVQENFQDAFIQLGDLLLIHGEYINQHSAKKHLDVLKQNVLYAHTHTVQQFDEGNLSAYNIGSVIDIDSAVFKYASRVQRSRWRNAFAIVILDKDKKAHVQIVRWINNSFIVNNKIYQ